MPTQTLSSLISGTGNVAFWHISAFAALHNFDR